MSNFWTAYVKLKLIVTLLMAMLLIGSIVPVRAQSGGNWNLVQMFPGTICGSYRNGSTPAPTIWILISLSGTWTSPVNYGIRNLPPGSTLVRTTFVNGNPAPYQPVPPGSGDGSGGARGRLEVTYHRGSTPPGTYQALLWAKDGSSAPEKTLPVTLVVKNEKCSRY